MSVTNIEHSVPPSVPPLLVKKLNFYHKTLDD